jgi:hypothetical protein
MDKIDNLLTEAVEKAGGYAAVAARLKPGKAGKPVTRQGLWGWLNSPGAKVPSTRVVELAEILGVSRHAIRPDVFPDE